MLVIKKPVSVSAGDTSAMLLPSDEFKITYEIDFTHSAIGTLLSGGRGGLGVFAGPSVGFLIGFPVAAFVAGLIVERWQAPVAAAALLGSVLGGVIVLYAFGIPGILMFIATLVDATKRIRFGTGTVNMPNTHPARVAAELAMLDHMLDGKFIMGI